MQDDKGRDYNNARRVAKEYEVVTKGLSRNAPSVPPQNSPDESKQVQIQSTACVLLYFLFHYLAISNNSCNKLN